MAEEAKRIRTSAKARFTRKRNEFLKSIKDNKGIDTVKRTFTELNEAWNTVEGKHDIYTIHLTEEEVEQSESWITELQELYNEAAAIQAQYINEQIQIEKKQREEINRQEAIRMEQERFQSLMEQINKKKKSMETIFETLTKHAQSLMESQSNGQDATPALRKTSKELDATLTNCNELHNKALELVDSKHAEYEIEWIRNVHAHYNEISGKIESFIAKEIGHDCVRKQNLLQLEKVKMPLFTGRIRDYPRFKMDFEKQVMPTINIESAPYILRSCLSKEPADVVKSIDDDLEAMWKRLDEKYGDPTKVVDVIMNAIQNTRNIRDGENNRLIELINIVEDGYQDLKRLGLEQEITTTSSVSVIEKKLPTDVKKEWAKLVSSDHSTVDKTNKFPSLLKFLLNQKQAIEYENAELRNDSKTKGFVHYSEKNDSKVSTSYWKPSKCLCHEGANHLTTECRIYLSKSVEERKGILKEKGACWSCLKRGHRIQECRNKGVCGVNDCTRRHHATLHEESHEIDVPASANTCNNRGIDTCLLQVQRIQTKKGFANVLWDNGASLCFITNKKAKEEKLKGINAQLSVVKVGGVNEKLTSRKYELTLIDKGGQELQIDVYGIDKITSDIQTINLDGVHRLFRNVTKGEIARPTGEVDVLIGFEYAGFHPQKEQSSEHLLLLKNRFGRCLGGTHPQIKERNERPELNSVQVLHSTSSTVEDFYNIENLGIECTPRCGGCKCGKCSLGSKNYTIKEEKELALIEKNLHYDQEAQRWIAEYPWIRDPKDLPDNRKAAFAKLLSTERRLAKNSEHAKVYKEQIQDMVNRGVARKLTKAELKNYKGPIHYISHHEVLKPDSKSTPVRIVFNSSAKYMGHVLNEYWAKGPDLLNNILAVLLRFREHEVAFIGDIKKMYHTVATNALDQHTHRFLWRDMETTREPDIYVIQRVSFGDKPSGAIATVALRKTAEMGKDQFPEASQVILNNTYMDDIIESVTNREKAKQITDDIEKLLNKGGFKLKEWTYSEDRSSKHEPKIPMEPCTATEKVLGVVWDPIKDNFHFRVKLIIPSVLTKRIILSQVNSIYDPLGLAGPYTVRAKILMRKLWTYETKLDWDDPIPEEYGREWMTFFSDLPQMERITVKRCLKPHRAIGDPILIIFSDGSNNAYGACAYVRWELPTREFISYIILSKNRLAPVKRMSIDRIELCGAVLNKRLKAVLQQQCRYKFQRYYHIVDSQIVHAMIHKETYGFNTFAATRVGEIQEGTEKNDWYWTESKNNIADWLTRGKRPIDIDINSSWQAGPDFLRLPESEWPITQTPTTVAKLPGSRRIY